MSDFRVGYARGAFDLFHIGHLNLLRHARSECDYLIAGVVTDDKLRSGKGVTPFVPEQERLSIVRSIRYVNEAVADGSGDVIEAWRQLGFTIFFKGDDWRGTAAGRSLEATLAEVDVEVVYFPYTASTSSTQLRRLIDSSATGALKEGQS